MLDSTFTRTNLKIVVDVSKLKENAQYISDNNLKKQLFDCLDMLIEKINKFHIHAIDFSIDIKELIKEVQAIHDLVENEAMALLSEHLTKNNDQNELNDLLVIISEDINNILDQMQQTHQQSIQQTTQLANQLQQLTLEPEKIIMPVSDSNNSQVNKKPISLLKEALRKHYLNSSVIPLLLYENTISLEQCYINLTLVDAAQQQAIEQKLLSEENLDNNSDNNNFQVFQSSANKSIHDKCLSSYKEIYSAKKLIALTDIFKYDSEQISTKRILIEGHAGIGKTTLCRNIVYRWAKKQLWPEYQAVFWIPLRNLRHYKHSELRVEQVIWRECLSTKQQDAYDPLFIETCLKEMRADQFLWILDGFDEIISTKEHRSLNHFLEQILKDNHYIITSRPGAYPIQENERHLEIVGFTQENIQAYIKQFCHELNMPQAVKPLQTLIHQNPNLLDMAHTPVNLELLCSTWLENQQQLQSCVNTELTLTTIYQTLLNNLIKRYLLQQGETKIFDLTNEELQQHPEVNDILNSLTGMAWQGLQQQKLILIPSDYLPWLEQLSPQQDTFQRKTSLAKYNIPEKLQNLFLHCGLIKSTTGLSKHNLIERNYYFIHVSFQKFLAASYIVRGLTKPINQKQVLNATTFILEKKWNPSYETVFWFVAGLLKDKPEGLKRYLTLLQDSTTQGLLGDYPIALLARVYEESISKASKLVLSHLKEQLIQTAARYYKAFTENKFAWIFPQTKLLFFAKLQLSPRLRKVIAAVIEEPLIHQLNNNNSNTLNSAIKFLYSGHLATAKILHLLITMLPNYDQNTRHEVTKVLAQIKEDMMTPELINKLLITLNNSDSGVRNTAAEILGYLGAEMAIPEILPALLITVLQDADWRVCYSAMEALILISEKNPTPELINWLLTLLQKKHSEVHKVAIKMFSHLEKEVVTIELVQQLLVTLKDKDPMIRRTTVQILGLLKEKAATNTLIQALAMAIQDSDSKVRQVAVIALINSKEKDRKWHVKAQTAEAFRDSNIRVQAIDMLNHLGKDVLTPEIINKLLAAMENNDLQIRWTATHIFNQLIEKKEAMAMLIPQLFTGLKHENAKIRCAAIEALSRVGKEVSEAYISALLSKALQDDDLKVRQAAIKALGQPEIGSEAKMLEPVLKKLITAAQDNDSRIRQAAIEALGQIGKKVESAMLVQRLLASLRDKDPQVRQTAILALNKLNEKALNTEVVQTLLGMLYYSDQTISQAILLVLSKLEEKIIHMLPQKLHADQAYLLFGWVLALRSINAEIQLRYQYQQDYSLKCFTEKFQQEVNLTPQQSQWLLHGLSAVNDIINGEMNYDIAHLEQVISHLPPTNQDPKLQAYQQAHFTHQPLIDDLLSIVNNHMASQKQIPPSKKQRKYYYQTMFYTQAAQIPFTDSATINDNSISPSLTKHSEIFYSSNTHSGNVTTLPPETFVQASQQLLTSLKMWGIHAELTIEHKDLIVALNAENISVRKAQSWLQQLSKLLYQYWGNSINSNKARYESDNLLHTFCIELKSCQHAKKLAEILSNSALFQPAEKAIPYGKLPKLS